MKFITRNLKKIIPLALVFTLALGTVNVNAATYKDVPSTHWAYSAVDSVSEKGFILGDLTGNFYPDKPLDKFETVKILARMGGYKYADATATEKAYYDTCFENNKTLINKYANQYSKWNSAVNKEIAFLLDKFVLTESDLQQFVLVVSGVERLSALSRENAAIFFVRLMGAQSAALSTVATNKFKDDSSITAANKNSAYYLRDKGIINGDGSNNFNPKTAVTRASMAIMVDKVYNIMMGDQSGTVTVAPSSSFTATIKQAYTAFRGLKVTSDDKNYNDKVLMVSANAVIKIDGVVRTFEDLQTGMIFSGTVSGNELSTINADSGISNSTGGSTTTLPAETTVAEGTVSTLITSAAGNYIGVEVKMLRPNGEIYSEVRTFIVPANCDIKIGTKSATFISIKKGDIVKVTASGATASSVIIQQKEIKISGEIIDKKYTSANQPPIFVVSDVDKNTYEFKITNTSKISRKGINYPTWNSLRVGDTVDVTAEYGNIIVIDAYGAYSNVDVFVKEITIRELGSFIIGTDATGNEVKYPILSSVDPYTFKIGNKLRLRLDSMEIERFTVLQEVNAFGTMTGTVDYLSSSMISVKDTANGNVVRNFRVDASTAITDSISGKVVSLSSITYGMKVYIVTSSADTNYAKTITILSYS